MCFRQQEKANGLDHGGSDAGSVKDPSPCRPLSDEATRDGTNSWTQERSQAVYSNSFATLLCVPAVSAVKVLVSSAET